MELGTGPLEDVFAWAQAEAARPDTPARAQVGLHALEARAERLMRGPSGAAPDPRHTLAADVVKTFSPLAPAVASVFEQHGIEHRPFAPPHLNVHYPGYARMCAERGWRPREVNA